MLSSHVIRAVVYSEGAGPETHQFHIEVDTRLCHVATILPT